MAGEAEDTGADEFGQPADEMAAEIDDLIGALGTDTSSTDEDAEADAIIDDTTEGGTEDESDGEAEQEDEEGEEETEGEETRDADEEEGSEADDGSEVEEKDEGEAGEDGEETESEPGSVEALTAANASLIDLVASLQKGPQPATKPLDTETSKSDTSETVDTPAPVVKAIMEDVLSGVDIDEAVSDPAKFNKVFQDFGTQLINATVQQIFTAIPGLISSQVVQQNSINRTVNDFYRENDDLEHVKPVVSATSNQVHSEHPDWTVEKVLDEAATRTRTMLGLSKQAVSQVKKKNPSEVKKVVRKSGLHTKKPGAKTKPSQTKTTKLEKEINDLMDL